MVLNSYQDAALDYIKDDYNILITGPAGSGKSYLIGEIVRWFNTLKKQIGITAMTGSAAYLIDGKTLHSWAGIDLGDKPVDDLCKKILKKPQLKSRWVYTKALIIDEVSMLTDELFDKLNIIGQTIRKNDLPFGGIQLILVGDFFQLPPVSTKTSFCFQSVNWAETIHIYIELKEIIRQTDVKFQNCLNELRIGECSKKTAKILKKCMTKSREFKDGILPTKLFSTRTNVSKINEERLLELGSTIHTHEAITIIEPLGEEYIEYYSDELSKRLDRDCQAVTNLKLAIGAQVVLLTNLSQNEGLVNGSRGIIISYEEGNPVVLFVNGIKKTITSHNWELEEENRCKVIKIQIPLQLAWAVTIHKCQGMSLDLVEVDIGSSIFEYGQSYTALSRVRSLEGLYIVNLDITKIKAHPKAIKFYKNFIMDEGKKEEYKEEYLNKNNLEIVNNLDHNI